MERKNSRVNNMQRRGDYRIMKIFKTSRCFTTPWNLVRSEHLECAQEPDTSPTLVRVLDKIKKGERKKW